VNQPRRFRVITAAILFAAATLPLRSQSPEQKPDDAKAIAHLLEEHYRHVRTLQGVFLERYSEGPKEARIETGTVYFQRPGRMRWEYESPEKKLFISDGKAVWFYVPADRTVTRAPVKESSDWRTPLALLTGKADLSKLCSRVDLVRQGAIPEGHALLRCLPKGEKEGVPSSKSSSANDSTALPGAGDFTEVLLEVDASTGELARIQIRQAGGLELEYRFGNWKQDLPLLDQLFRFQPPAGVAIVDGAALDKSQR
jgi:outer membrane lipoprotein carrier protein